MAGRIILGIFNPALDANGEVDSGCTLTFYANGTTTPQNVYTDSGLGTPLSNSLSCDAAGRFPEIWAENTSTYSVKVTPTGASPITYDGITAIPNTTAPTRQVLTSGTTYTTPAGARQLKVRVKGGGGGGGGVNNTNADGTAGTASSFNSITAAGGSGGGDAGPGAGGTGGTGSGTSTVRTPGAPGGTYASQTTASAGEIKTAGGSGGGTGGGKGLNGAAGAGTDGVTNSGGGGGGGSVGSTTFATLGALFMGNGGGEGETVEFIINAPSSSYTYAIGGGGTGGTGGSGGTSGGAGGSGRITVDEYY